MLPASLIRDFASGAPWVLIAEEGTARRRQVEFGLQGDTLVQVLSGLAEGDAIIAPDAAVERDEPVRARPAQRAI